jgi:hypothetical protein
MIILLVTKICNSYSSCKLPIYRACLICNDFKLVVNLMACFLRPGSNGLNWYTELDWPTCLPICMLYLLVNFVTVDSGIIGIMHYKIELLIIVLCNAVTLAMDTVRCQLK